MILNNLFDVADIDPGRALGWTTTTLGRAEETAEFAGDSASTISAYETFEHGYGNTDPQRLVPVLVTATEDRISERFEIWQPRLDLALSVLEAAVFNAGAPGDRPSTFDGFGPAWMTIDPELGFTLEPGMTERLSVDTFATWGDFLPTLVGTQSASFGAGGLSTSSSFPLDVERFVLRARQRVYADVGANTMRSAGGVSLGFVTGDAVTFSAEQGALPEPLSAESTYLASVGAELDRFAVLTAPGTSIDLVSTGTGAHYVFADPARIWVDEL